MEQTEIILTIKMNNGDIIVLRDEGPFENTANKFFWDGQKALLPSLIEISKNKWINPSHISSIEVK